MIKDSGERREFESGAVRDIVEGKGRCDLLPLGTISDFLICDSTIENIGLVLRDIFLYQETKCIDYLYNALDKGIYKMFEDVETALLELSIHFEEGAKKYGEYNWQKGIPQKSYIDSAIRHLLKWSRGDNDERHDRAFLWNIVCLIWTIENIKVEENEVI